MSKGDYPMSEKISEYCGGNYLITAAKWAPVPSSESYEIGIRGRGSLEFWLIQNSNFDSQSVQEVANAIAMLLGDPTQNYTPEWCCEWFGREG